MHPSGASENATTKVAVHTILPSFLFSKVSTHPPSQGACLDLPVLSCFMLSWCEVPLIMHASVVIGAYTVILNKRPRRHLLFWYQCTRAKSKVHN